MDPLAFLSVEHRVGARYGVGPDGWCAWSRHAIPVLEWIDADGMATRVEGVAGGRPFARPAGRWHLYGDGTAYSERYAAPERIREHCWFFFRARNELGGVRFAAIDDPEGRLLAYGRTMHAVQSRGEAHAARQLHGLLWAACGEVLTAMRRGGDGSPERPWTVRGDAPTETLLARLDAAVVRRLADPPPVRELAAALHLSESALGHRLKAESGMTVVERVRFLRVREARRLLSAGASVKEAAARLGFSSPTYFTRVFRAVAGCAPADYRDRSRPTPD